VYVKEKNEKKRKNIVKVKVCVCICFMDVLFIHFILFYDKIAKAKEEFNILICSR